MQTDVTPPRPSRAADDRPDRLPLDELPRWVPHADPVALLLTTAHLTGDLGLLRAEWRPDLRIGVAEGGYPEPVCAEIRQTCLDALGKVGESWDRDRPTYDTLQRVVEWAMSPEFAAYTQLLGDTLSFGPGDDPGRPSWRFSAVAADPDFRVAVVGAGESGLLMAHRLRQAGVPVVVFERNSDVGGTWHENTYPGCRVDIPSQVYRYSCHPGTWESHFSTRPAIAEYLRGFARDNGLYDCVELGSEVLGSRWDGERRTWVLTVRSADGIREVRANVQVSAVGQFGRPYTPDIPGAERFGGVSFHTAHWDHSVDLTGKRVGVIGTGATAVQLVPEIADRAAEVRVYSRTPTFLAPTPKLRRDLGAEEQALLAGLPHYRAWYRAVEVLPTIEGNLAMTTVDPAFPPTERAVSAPNEQLRALLQGWIDVQTTDDPHLRAALTPRFPFGAKRWVTDDGTWVSTLRRPDVHLVDEPIEEVTATGVRTVDGHDQLDVLVYATGYRPAEFLAPMRVTGRGGADLTERWSGDDARAYRGACVPGFPNFFCVFGPNMSNVVHLVSIFFVSECGVRYVLDAVRTLLESGSRSIEVRADVAQAYADRLDEVSAQRAWGFSTVRSWYRNSRGRSTQLWPFSAMELWQRTRRVDPADFRLGA